MPVATPIEITPQQKRELERVVHARTSTQRELFRARIVLALMEGRSHEEISRQLDTSLQAVSRWRKRWAQGGLQGLKDVAGRGRRPSLKKSAVQKALSLAGRQAPTGGPWTVRAMARQSGMSKSSVQRLWSAHRIAPHRVRGFKLSKDLEFEEKFWDVVGLYLQPPDRA